METDLDTTVVKPFCLCWNRIRPTKGHRQEDRTTTYKSLCSLTRSADSVSHDIQTLGGVANLDHHLVQMMHGQQKKRKSIQPNGFHNSEKNMSPVVTCRKVKVRSRCHCSGESARTDCRNQEATTGAPVDDKYSKFHTRSRRYPCCHCNRNKVFGPVDPESSKDSSFVNCQMSRVELTPWSLDPAQRQSMARQIQRVTRHLRNPQLSQVKLQTLGNV